MDTREAVEHIVASNIAGDFVECGVFRGAQPRLMAETLLRRAAEPRDIHLFDTFAGMTEPGPFDMARDDTALVHFRMSQERVHKEWTSNRLDEKTNRWCRAALEVVKQNLAQVDYPADRWHFVIGDVMRTLREPENLPERIALLRLDTDWYESSKLELEVLFPLLCSGGVLILDDYFHWDGQRRATDEYCAEQGMSLTILKASSRPSVGYCIKP